ncbi:hypothetical protein Tco_0500668 [Tanacetum coccineum]
MKCVWLPESIVSTQGTHRTIPNAHRSPTLTTASPQKKKRKEVAGEKSSPSKSLKVTIRQKKKSRTPLLPPGDDREMDEMAEATLLSLTLHKTALAAEAKENIAKVQKKLDEEEIENMVEDRAQSHKEHLEHVDDDDETEKEKKDDKKDDEKANDDEKKDETDSMEIRKKKMQTPIPSPTRSPRKNLSLDKNISQELTKSRMEKKYVTNSKFWKVHGKVDKVLHEIIPQIAEKATNDVIEGTLKIIVVDIVIQERDALQVEVPALISKEFADQAPQIIEELFKSYVSNNVIQSNLQDQATDPELWDVLKRKFEKSSTSTTSCRDDAFCPQHHDDHQEDDAPPKGEKRAKRHKTSKSSKYAKSSLSKQPTNTTPELIDEFQNADKHITTIYDYARMMATLHDVMSNQFKDAEENANEPPRYLYNKDLFFLKYENTEERSYILSLHKIHDVPFPEDDLEEKLKRWHELDYMEQIIMMRENDKPDSFSEADFKYLNKNDIEDLYYLFLNKKVDFRENKLKNSLITCIRSSHDPFSIVDKPSTSLVYLNNKEEKRVMYLAEIVKFCDATLERVLKEVKLKIFKSEPWKKPPLLGKLDRDIMKAFEREIRKRLRHREHMRRWESFMNGRPILPAMRRP